MVSVEPAARISRLHRDAVNLEELEYIAFSGQHEIAHGVFRSIPQERRAHYTNKFILSEVIVGGVKKLRTFLSVSAEVAAKDEKRFIDETVEMFIQHARSTESYPRELFESLLLWSSELTKLSLLQEAVRLYDNALATGVSKFPDLYVRTVVGKANVLNTVGKFKETQSLLSSLAERPFLVTDRNIVPELLFNLAKESLLKGDVRFYKSLMFRGLENFYTNLESRRLFVDQIRKTYRRSLKVLTDPGVTPAEKILYSIHRICFAFQGRRLARYVGVAKAARFALLGYVYTLNYVLPSLAKSHRLEYDKDRQVIVRPHRRCNILITRAMGGIGDLLMMTPGIHELKNKYPHEEIYLAIPKRYFSLFHENADVHLIDIESDTVDQYTYRKWFNFTDCPAARNESRTAPKVRKDRIELFAEGLGIGRFGVRRMQKLPRYSLTEDEKAFQQKFWREHGLDGRTVIGVQLHSDEVYRDYPHMKQFVMRLADRYNVIVFDSEAIHAFDSPNVTKVAGMPMRKAFAIASACTAIVAPDSAFVHIAAALDVPCVALFGPIDGKMRTQHYPKCKYIDVRHKLGCMPCWRNDRIPCKLTNMRTSVCMSDISLNDIEEALTEVLERKNIQ